MRFILCLLATLIAIQPAFAQSKYVQHAAGKVSVPVLKLSDGRLVKLKDWTLVFFMSSSCSYCQTFKPLIKTVSQDIGLPVFVYRLDGKGVRSFPKALLAPPMVIRELFAQGLPIDHADTLSCERAQHENLSLTPR